MLFPFCLCWLLWYKENIHTHTHQDSTCIFFSSETKYQVSQESWSFLKNKSALRNLNIKFARLHLKIKKKPGNIRSKIITWKKLEKSLPLWISFLFFKTDKLVCTLKVFLSSYSSANLRVYGRQCFV